MNCIFSLIGVLRLLSSYGVYSTNHIFFQDSQNPERNHPDEEAAGHQGQGRHQDGDDDQQVLVRPRQEEEIRYLCSAIFCSTSLPLASTMGFD